MQKRTIGGKSNPFIRFALSVTLNIVLLSYVCASVSKKVRQGETSREGVCACVSNIVRRMDWVRERVCECVSMIVTEGETREKRV